MIDSAWFKPFDVLPFAGGKEYPCFPLTPAVHLLQAQKPKNKTLAKMFEELKELYDKQKALESEQPAMKQIGVS